MHQFREFYLPSTDGEHMLHVCSWLPEGNPRGVVQLSHGIAEYAARYDHYAGYLADRGYYVIGNDHLGHGKTAPSEKELVYPGKAGGWLTMAEDLFTVYQHARPLYPGVPYVLLGHSMGSFLARSFLILHPGCVDGCILSGTGQEAAAVVKAGSLLTGVLSLVKGGNSYLPLVQNLCFGSYNKKIKTPCTKSDWLSRDPAQVAAYLADPLCGGDTSTAMARELLFGLQYIWKGKNLRQMDRSTPIYLYSGEADPVGTYGKGVKKVARRLQKLGCTQVTVKLYPEGRHEMHNELNRRQVYHDTLEWLRTLEGGKEA